VESGTLYRLPYIETNVMKFLENLRESPVIAAVREMGDLDYALKKKVRVIFLLAGDIFNLIDIEKRMRAEGHLFLLHLDLIRGIARDQVGITYLKKFFGIDGIISTHSNIIQYAKKQGLIALQRLFIVDSESLKSGDRLVQSSKPDSVEILPGIILPYIQPELDKLHLPPIVAGGLIKTRDDVDRILASGAVAVSTSRRELW
jgi:glycerol uptake operon antiterminator